MPIGCSRALGAGNPLSSGHLFALAVCAACVLAFGGDGLLGVRGRAAGTGSELSDEALDRRLGGTASSNSTSSEHAAHVSGAVNPAIFFLVTFLCSAIAQFVTTFLPNEIRMPHSVLLYFIGTFMAYCAFGPAKDSEYGHAVQEFASVDPHVIFWVFLPALLYEDASRSEWHVIKRVMPSALLLALPGVIINTVLTGLFIRYCMNGWSWWMSLLLGSILSATDPVAVVGALQALSAPAKLSHLISGEALFNDGSAVALFQIFLAVATGKSEFQLGNAIGTLCQLAFGGPAFGFAIAVVACAWLKQTRTLNIQVLIILCCVYGAFFVGEYKFKVSGVLAVVVLGLYMASTGRFSLNVGVGHEYHSIIGFLSLISNESIFILAGVIGYKFMSDGSIDGRDFLDLGLLYIAIHVTRTLVIVIMWPLLTRMGYGLTVPEAIITVYGGLRGAVGLAMASVVAGDWELGPDSPDAKRIGFHTAGIVVLTLLINGTSITSLYKWLKVGAEKNTRHHAKLLRAGLADVDAQVENVMNDLKAHWFFHNCDFDIIEKLVPRISALVLHERLDFFGRVKRLHHTKDHVDKVFVELAQKMAVQINDDPNDLRLHVDEKLVKRNSLDCQDLRACSPGRVGKRNFTFFSLNSYGELMSGVNPEMQSEVYQAVVNAVGAEYQEEYENGCLPVEAYRVLCISLQYQEEAILGELGLPKYGVPRPSFLRHENCAIHQLAKESRTEQLKKAFLAGWMFLNDSLQHHGAWGVNLLRRVLGYRTLALDWVLLTRNIFILLQFVKSIDHVLLDSRVFDDFEALLHKPLREVKDQAVKDGMSKWMSEDHGLFILVEHALAARQIIGHMRTIVHNQRQQGTLTEEDAELINSEVLQPSEKCLEDFIPLQRHLSPLSSSNAHRVYPWLDRFIFDLVLERGLTRLGI